MKPFNFAPEVCQRRIRKTIASGLAIGMGVCGIPGEVLYASDPIVIKSGIDYGLPEKQVQGVTETPVYEQEQKETTTDFLNNGPLTAVTNESNSAEASPAAKSNIAFDAIILNGSDAKNSGQDGWTVNGSSTWRARSSQDHSEALKFNMNAASSGDYDLEIFGKNFGQNLPPFYKTFLLDIYVDGEYVKTASLNASTQTQSVITDLELAAGNHEIAIGWTNDYWVMGIFDTNLQIDSLKLQKPPVVLPPDPLVNRAPVIDGGILSSVSDGDSGKEGLQIKAGSTVTYSAKASDSNGDPLQWAWFYSVSGDQHVLYKAGSGAVANISFTYPQNLALNYNWMLRVSDGYQETVNTLVVETFIPASPIPLKLVMQDLSVQSSGLSIKAVGRVIGFDPVRHRAQAIIRNTSSTATPLTIPLQINPDGTFSLSREMAAGSYEVEIRVSTLIAGSATQEATLLKEKRAVTVQVPQPPSSVSITGIEVSNISATGALIGFLTSSQATARMRYGLEPGKYNSVSDGDMGNMLMTEHGIQLSGLKIGATYYYVIEATDANGNKTVSKEFLFTTRTPGVNVLSPAQNGDVAITGRTVEALAVYENMPADRTDVHSHFCILSTADATLSQLDTMDRTFMAMDLNLSGKAQVKVPSQIQESGTVYLYSWAVEGDQMIGIKNTLKVRAINLNLIKEPINTKPVIEGGIRHNLTDDDPTREGLQVPAGRSVTFSAKASDADGNKLNWTWLYFVNGASPVVHKSGSGPVESVDFTYPEKSAANYIWMLKVSDGMEEVTASIAVQVIYEEPKPVMVEIHDLTLSQPVNTLSVKLDTHVQGYAGSRHKVEVELRKADGALVSKETVTPLPSGMLSWTKTVSAAGNYTVKVIVTDTVAEVQVGTKQASMTVNALPVTPNPSPTPAPTPVPTHPHDTPMDTNAEILQTHHDKIPNFGKNYTAINIKSGNWSDASIWQGGIVPAEGAIVRIAKGTTIVYDVTSDSKLNTVGVEGKLEFATNKNTRMRVTNMLVYDIGELEVGTEADPIQAGVKAEVIINNAPLDIGTETNPGKDPSQFGTGMIVFGKLTMVGREMDATYATPAAELLAGATTVTLDSVPSGWAVGDTLVIPDGEQPFTWGTDNTSFGDGETKLGNYKGEERVIIAINANTVTFNSPLLYNHLGGRNPDGTVAMANGKPMIAPLANLGRNIMVRSENPEGTRGHVLFTGRAEIDVRYAAFKDLGRTIAQAIDSTTYDAGGKVTHIGTNQVGRYAFHFHHTIGAKPPEGPYQFRTEGNAIYGGKRWGLVVHGSHYGLIKDNIVYDIDGTGITVEDGTEYGNIFEGNYVLRISGDPKLPTVVGHRDEMGSQNEGDGFWIQGTGNHFKNNIVGNVRGVGYNVFLRDGTVYMNIPAKQGDDPHKLGESIRGSDQFSMVPMLSFEENTVFGSHIGFETWRVRFTYPGETDDAISIKNFVGWNTTRVLHVPFGTTGLIVDGLIARGKTNTLDNRWASMGLDLDAGYLGHLKLNNFDVQGFDYGIRNSSTMSNGGWTISNGKFRNQVNVDLGGFVHHRENDLHLLREVILNNVHHEALPGKALRAIEGVLGGSTAPNMPTSAWRILILNHNGTGQNYQMFFDEQRPDYLIPDAFVHDADAQRIFYGCPAGNGRTNQQCWEESGVAMGMEMASCLLRGDNASCTASKSRGSSLGIKGIVVPYDGVSSAPISNALANILPLNIWPVTGGWATPDVFQLHLAIFGKTSNVKNAVVIIDGVQEKIAMTDLDARDNIIRVKSPKALYNFKANQHTLTYYLEDASGAEITGTRVSRILNPTAPLPPPPAPNPNPNPNPVPPPPAPILPKIVTAESFTAAQAPVSRNVTIAGQLIGYEPGRHTAKVEIRTAANALVGTVVLTPDKDGVFSFTQTAMSAGEFIARIIVGDTAAANQVVLDKTKTFTIV